MTHPILGTIMGVILAVLISWPLYLILDTVIATIVMVGSAIAMGIVGSKEPVFSERE